MVSENPFADLDEYELRHLAVHLERAKRFADLHRVLWLEWTPDATVSTPQRGMQGWLNHLTRRERTTPQSLTSKNAWYEMKEERGDIDGYLADVERAWQLTESDITSERDAARPGSAIGLQCGYALCKASIGRLALNIPTNLLVALVKRKIWTPTRAVVYAEHVPDEERRATALAALAPHLQEPLIYRAMTAIRLITYSRRRVQALIAYIPYIPLAERSSLLMEVLTTIRALANAEQWKARIFESGSPDLFVALLPHLSQTERMAVLPEAFEVIRAAASQGDYHEDSIVALTPYLAESQLGEALAIIKSLSQDGPKASAFARIAPYLPEPLMREAREYARSFRQPLDQALALAGLALNLPEPQRTAAISEALQVARKEKQPGDGTVELLVTLAGFTPHLPVSQQYPLLNKILKLVSHKLKYSWYQAEVLEKVAKFLPESLFDKALHEAQKLGREDTFRALLGLLPYIPEAMRPAVLTETLESARKVRQDISRFVYSSAEALAMVASLQPEQEQDDLLREALTLARNVPTEPYDQEAEKLLAELAILLAASSAPVEAMKVARSLQDHKIRVHAYEGMAPYLAENQLRELLDDGRALRNVTLRAKVLMAVAPYLPEQERVGAFAEALETARADASEQFLKALTSFTSLTTHEQLVRRAFVLSNAATGNTPALYALSPILSEDLLLQALEGVRKIDRARNQADVLICLAPYLPAHLLHTAKDIANKISYIEKLGDNMGAAMSNLDAKSRALAALAPQLARIGSIQEALIAAREVNENDVLGTNQSRTLLDMARYLPEQSLDEALSIARSIEHAPARVRALVGLVPMLAEQRRAVVISEAIAIVRTISFRFVDRLPALMELEPLLPKAVLLQEAMLVVQEVQASSSPVSDATLTNMTTSLANLGEHEQALLLVQRMASSGSERANALTGIIPYLEKTQLLQVEQHFQLGSNELAVAQVQRLAELGFFEEALAVVLRIEDRDRLLLALRAIVPFEKSLPLETLYTLWRKALHSFASHTRKDLLSDIRTLAPFIVRLGNIEGVMETSHAVQNVTCWWS